MKVRGRERCFSGILRLHKTPTPRQPLTIAMIILFLAFLSYVVCGCGSSSSTKNLKDYSNKMGIDFNGSMIAAQIRGKVLETENNGTVVLAKVRLSSFEVLPGPVQVQNESSVKKGSEVVLDIHKPPDDFKKGKEITATVRIAKTEGGHKLFAENVAVL